MNEADSVFAKAGSLLDVPYIEPSFLGSLNVKSVIPRSQGILKNDINNVMCYMNYHMCYVYVVVCCVQNVKYDDASYSHGINFLIHVWKPHKPS